MWIKKGILGLTLTLTITGIGILLWKTDTAQATVYNNYTAALDGAPQGVDLNSDEYKDYFWHANDVTGVTSSNSAKVVNAGSPIGSPNSAIQISRAGVQNSWGAIWSNDKVFDLRQPESASMWIYASTEADYVKQGLGDGMAFVLQNSDDGVKAFAKATTLDSNKNNVYTPGIGESMGVWGMDPEDWHLTNLGNNAIKNSWALEFDTFNNTSVPSSKLLITGLPTWNLDDSAPSSFDLGKYYNTFDTSGNPTGSGSQVSSTNNHIASNYPGDSSIYTGVPNDGYKTNIWGKDPLFGTSTWYTSGYTSSTYYYYKMQHLGYLDEGKNADATTDRMTDHRWHHITLTYTPPTGSGMVGSMKYVYDDKNTDTGLPQTPANSTEVPIKLSEFNLKDSSMVRWGFTGSTGASTENNLVIFDQLPGEAQTSASATLSAKNKSGDYQPVGDSVTGGSQVKLEYEFKHEGGLKDWQGVNASLQIPKSITLTSGKVTNPDGSDGGKVDLSKISGTSLPVSMGTGGNGVSLSGTQSGKITLYGTVKDANASESATTSYFQGSNATSVAELPAYNVKKAVLQTSASATLSTKDDSGNYAPVDTSETPIIPGGSQIRLEYDFERDGGPNDWQDVNAALTIPKSIKLTSGKITNPDDSNGGDVDLSKLVGTNLVVPLGSDGSGVTLSGTQKGKIVLYGTTVDNDATESKTTSNFQGSNGSASADLTAFTVKHSLLGMDIDDSVSTLAVNYGVKGSDASVVGVAVLHDKNGTPLQNTERDAITIHPILNGVAQDTFKLSDEAYINPNYASTGFTYPIVNSKLTKQVTNTIEFYATDAAGDRSPTISRDIIAGIVKLGATSGNLSFGNATLTGIAGTTLSRDGNWSLDVDNSLTKGTNWELDATTSGMYQKDTAVASKLDGALVYPDENGFDVPLSDSAMKIASGSSDGTINSTNIAQSWTANNGIRLKINNGATQGKYEGTIVWSLVNSPQ